MRKYTQISILMFCAGLFFISGIYRDDVSKEKYIKLGNQPQFNCVGKVLKDTNLAGSCVVIGSKFVLSAAHVFIESDSRADTMKIAGKTVITNTPVNSKVGDITTYVFKFNGKRYRGKSINIPSQYFAEETKGTCDIALITLQEEVSGINYPVCNKYLDELNADVTGLGFGASGPAAKPAEVGFHNEKIAGENVIDSIGGLKINNKNSLLLCDFDHPDKKRLNKMGSAIPKPLEYLGAGGDSGGGLFRFYNGKWQLVGIYSQTDLNVQQLIKTGYYGGLMKWTRISVFNDWIEAEMKK